MFQVSRDLDSDFKRLGFKFHDSGFKAARLLVSRFRAARLLVSRDLVSSFKIQVSRQQGCWFQDSSFMFQEEHRCG